MTDRHLKWILLGSLLFNALLIGFLAGQVGRGGLATFDLGAPAFRQGLERPMSADRPSQGILREALEAERPAMAKALADMAAARARSVALIRAENLDAGALESAMGEIRASGAAAQAAFHRAIGTAAAKLDGPRRAALAQSLGRAAPSRANPRRPFDRSMGGGTRGRVPARR